MMYKHNGEIKLLAINLDKLEFMRKIKILKLAIICEHLISHL